MLFVSITCSAFSGDKERGKVVPDTINKVRLLFQFDSSVVDSSFMHNTQNLNILHRMVTNEDIVSNLDSIIVTATSSPDGAPAYNRKLIERRANSLKSYLLDKYPHLDRSKITTHIENRYWEGLIDAVERDRNVPGRKELLAMLNNPRLTDAEKSRRMEAIEGGATFAYLRRSFIFRYLRTGAVTIRAVVSQPPLDSTPQPISLPEATTELPAPAINEIVPQSRVLYPIAIKTNLLLDVLGGPNLGIELPVGKRISVAADFAYAHTRVNNSFALQTIQGSVEGRYWITQGKNPFTGWNIGLYGSYSGRFDMQLNEGYQGDGYWSAGVSAGYSIPLTPRFNLEFSIGGGYIYSPEVRHYHKDGNGMLLWQETRYDTGTISLTRVNVNLTWIVGFSKKTKK